MSWEVLLLKFPDDVTQPEQVPDDYLPPPVGSRGDVAAAIDQLFRNVDYAGGSYIAVERKAFSLEINLGD